MIHLRNVAKRYSLRQYRGRTLREYLLHTFISADRGGERWALRDVSLDIERGESVALLGANGSGKSTLLRIISGVTHVTSGTVDVNGRVGGVIDLAAGFHTDLTGYENIFLHGTLMGIPRSVIRKRLPEIEDFCELGGFLNTPVRQYSWGMLLRLDFSISVFTDPDVFIVDEALSVGDGYFQWKCLQKIRELKASGVTLLFVSHLPALAESMCEKAAWIKDGIVADFGPSNTVTSAYHRDLFNQTNQNLPRGQSEDLLALVPTVRIGTGEAAIRDVQIVDENGVEKHAFEKGETITINFTVDSTCSLDATAAVSIVRPGQAVLLAYSSERGTRISLTAGSQRISLKFPNVALHSGAYYLSLSVNSAKDFTIIYDGLLQFSTFTIHEPKTDHYSPRIVELQAKVEYERI